MKTKRENEDLSLKFIPIIFAISSIVCISIRAYQMLFLIDAQTGFNLQTGFLNYAIYLALGIASFILLSLSYVHGETFEMKSAKFHSDTLSVVSSVFSGVLIFDGIVCLLGAFTSTSAIVTSIIGVVYEESALTYLRGFFAILSAGYFIILAKDYRNDSSDSTQKKILALAPVAWMGFKLMSLFSTQISFLRVSDLVLELFMLAFMLNFFLSFAQFNSNVYREGFTWKLYGFGLCASLISLTINVPRLIFTFVQDGVFVNSAYPLSLVNLICAIFALVFIFRDIMRYYEDTEQIQQLIDMGTLEASVQNSTQIK